MIYKWSLNLEEEGIRLLSFIRNKLNSSNSEIRWLIEHQHCFINGKCESFASRKLSSRDKILFFFEKKPNFSFTKERVLFEDEFLLAYDKPAYLPMKGVESIERYIPYSPIHRLDRDTTGVLLFAKDQKTSEKMEALFRQREIKKTYKAILHGSPREDRGIIENRLGPISKKEGEVTMGLSPKGEIAITEWEIVSKSKNFSLATLYPKTGRTHQLRVHMSSLGHPIVGDMRYGNRRDIQPRILLHAESLEFIHPITGNPLRIESPLPEKFTER